jgi:dipeptidyl aminopeptidase/acylaminoacyl peptidase
MRIRHLAIVLFSLFPGSSVSQALWPETTPVDFSRLKGFVDEREVPGRYDFTDPFRYMDEVSVDEFYYMSDGLRVKGFIARPRGLNSCPIIIYNRGGNREFGKITREKLVYIFGRLASWGYVVIGSQYRGNDGGDGMEQFGGEEVNDILNLIPLVKFDPGIKADRIGMYGWSRGGMMTYLVLSRTDKIKAAVVGGGLSDLEMMKNSRPVMEEVYEELIPYYKQNVEWELRRRSAIHFANDIGKTTPILMLHGSADWRVVPQMALDLSAAFIKTKVPHRLILFEGGDHGLTEFRQEVDNAVKQWFDSYLKEDAPLPNLEPHGR